VKVKAKNIAKIIFVFLTIFSWIFSGWPQVFNFPPKIQVAQAATETFTTAGTFTNGWTAPADVYSVTAETWGGGGGSGGGTIKYGPGGSGGGGGAYASKVISVTPGNSYTYVVGAAGLASGGAAGGNSSFTGNASVQSLACGGTSGANNGGTAGAGGTTACSDGTDEFAGGAGAAGAGTSGGGGGESAGTTATGGSASGTIGGTGTDGTDGSAGQLVNVVGVAGNNPSAGAGGAGGRSGGSKVGAAGGVGQVRLTYTPITIALTGTVTASITEADIVTGGKTIILTVTGDTWVAAGATFDAQRQNIIDGIDSAQAEGTGWDTVVKATQGVSGVVRTSDTIVTITLDAFASYDITATETITATIPATALVGGNAIVATPTFDITAVEFSSAIEIRAQDYTTSVTTIAFPQGTPETTVSQPYNNIDGSGNPQTFGGAGVAKPVVTLYNSGTSTLTIWYNITTFTNGIVSSENYLVNAKGAACADASCITGSVTFDADTTTGTTIATGVGNEKDLYLKAILSAVAGKSGNSTLTILGEAL